MDLYVEHQNQNLQTQRTRSPAAATFKTFDDVCATANLDDATPPGLTAAGRVL